MMLRTVKNRGLYIAMMAVAAMVALPMLPSTFSKRMDTIENHKADESASTRIAVWTWTLGYVADHFGGGFQVFLANKLTIHTQDAESEGGGVTTMKSGETGCRPRLHSAYFEMLGEQGWPGLILWLTIQISGIVQLEGVQRRLRKSTDPRDRKDAGMALALQQGTSFIWWGPPSWASPSSPSSTCSSRFRSRWSGKWVKGVRSEEGPLGRMRMQGAPSVSPLAKRAGRAQGGPMPLMPHDAVVVSLRAPHRPRLSR
jgi:hypothetical protein